MERLAYLKFVRQAQNLFITEASGTGKSFLGTALGYQTCKSDIHTFYANASKLLEALKVAKAKGTIEAELRKIEQFPLLILGDLFLVPLDAKERPLLLNIIEDRRGRKSIISLHKSRYPTGMTPSETRPCQMRYWSGLYTRRTKLN